MNLKLCPSLKAREHLIHYFQDLSGSINLSWEKKIFSEQMFSNKSKTFHEVFFITDMFHDFKESISNLCAHTCSPYTAISVILLSMTSN